MPDFFEEEVMQSRDDLANAKAKVESFEGTRPLDKQKFSAAYQAMCAASQLNYQLEKQYECRRNQSRTSLDGG